MEHNTLLATNRGQHTPNGTFREKKTLHGVTGDRSLGYKKTVHLSHTSNRDNVRGVYLRISSRQLHKIYHHREMPESPTVLIVLVMATKMIFV